MPFVSLLSLYALKFFSNFFKHAILVRLKLDSMTTILACRRIDVSIPMNKTSKQHKKSLQFACLQKIIAHVVNATKQRRNYKIIELSIKHSKESTKTLCLLKIGNKVVEVG